MSKRAAGLIIFKQLRDSFEYLLLRTSYGEKHWTPPKGHLDEGETDIEAAVRETREESGLERDTDYAIIDQNSFNIELNYPVRGKPKTVIYFLAEYINQDKERIKLSDEHIEYKWLPVNDAVEVVNYELMQNALRTANDYLINRFRKQHHN